MSRPVLLPLTEDHNPDEDAIEPQIEVICLGEGTRNGKKCHMKLAIPCLLFEDWEDLMDFVIDNEWLAFTWHASVPAGTVVEKEVNGKVQDVKTGEDAFVSRIGFCCEKHANEHLKRYEQMIDVDHTEEALLPTATHVVENIATTMMGCPPAADAADA